MNNVWTTLWCTIPGAPPLKATPRVSYAHQPEGLTVEFQIFGVYNGVGVAIHHTPTSRNRVEKGRTKQQQEPEEEEEEENSGKRKEKRTQKKMKGKRDR